MKHFKDMPLGTAIGTAEALIEAFFNVQPDKHVQDWRWDCFSKGNYHYWPQYSNCIYYGSREHE